MIKRMLLMMVAVAVLVGGMIGFKFMMATGAKKFLATQAVPAQAVSTIKVTAQDWQQELEAIGTLHAINGADLSSEASGIVETLSFDSGADVEPGAVLIHLRDADDVAQLRALEATAKLAQVTLDRDLKQALAVDIDAESEKYLPFRKIEHELQAQRAIRDSSSCWWSRRRSISNCRAIRWR